MKRLATFSFDDGGWQDAEVMEHLRVLSVPGTFYLPSRLLLESVYAGRNLDEIHKLYTGWEVGAHGRTHRRLPRLTAQELADETAGCRRDLSEFFTRDINLFSYPYGDHGGHAVTAVKNAGFIYARTCLRDAPDGLAHAKDHLRQPIVGIVDEGFRCMDSFDAAVRSGWPVHVVGHSWSISLHGWFNIIENMVEELRKNDYAIVPNGKFFQEVQP